VNAKVKFAKAPHRMDEQKLNSFFLEDTLLNCIYLRSSMASRSERLAYDRRSYAKFAMASHRIGDQNLLSRAPPCFGRHVKVPVACGWSAVRHSNFKES
jgi:hypothetical protein